MLLADACTEYVFSCKVRRLSEKTIDNYRKQILYWNRYLDEVCDVQEVEKVRPIHIKNFIILKEKDKRKPAYINDLLKAYRSFFNYCVEEEYIDESPLAKVKNVKELRVIINTFTLTDIKKMLEYAGNMKFCSHCGKQILKDAVVCPHCGCATESKASVTDEPNKGLNIISFLLPIVGAILYLVYHEKEPKKAAAAGKWALYGLGFSVICYVLLVACTAMI